MSQHNRGKFLSSNVVRVRGHHGKVVRPSVFVNTGHGGKALSPATCWISFSPRAGPSQSVSSLLPVGIVNSVESFEISSS